MKGFENEIKTLSKVSDHDHLIKVKGTYTDRKWLAMLLDPVADGNLKEYMSDTCLTSTQDQALFRTYFGCLADTIKYLHDTYVGIIHKDIKPENVLLKRGHLILTDFGTAYDWSASGQSMTRSNAEDVRTPRYMSPEVAHGGRFHRSSDIWSLGVVLLEMVTILRGKRLIEMDEFLNSHGHKETAIHNNLESALAWFEVLQPSQHGLPTDNEPLSWLKEMLNCEHTIRPSAAEIADTIAAFDVGQFCGKCCKAEDTDSSSDEGIESDRDVLSVIEEEQKAPAKAGANAPPSRILAAEASGAQDDPVSRPAASAEAPVDRQDVKPCSTALEPGLTHRQPSQALAGERHSSSKGIKKAPKKPSKNEGTNLENPSATSGPTSKKHSTKTTKAQNCASKDALIQWLASTRERFKAPSLPASKRRVADFRALADGQTPAAEHQRIAHYLSSLLEGPADFEDTANDFTSVQDDMLGFASFKRSSTWAAPVHRVLNRSRSQEDLQSSSHLLQEEADDDQFADVNMSRPLRCPSENNIPVALQVSKEELREAAQELKAFAFAHKETEIKPKGHFIEGEKSAIVGPEKPKQILSATDEQKAYNIKSQFENVFDDNAAATDVTGPGLKRLRRREREKAREVHAIDSAAREKVTVRPGSLQEFLAVGKQPRKKRFESAFMIRDGF